MSSPTQRLDSPVLADLAGTDATVAPISSNARAEIQRGTQSEARRETQEEQIRMLQELDRVNSLSSMAVPRPVTGTVSAADLHLIQNQDREALLGGRSKKKSLREEIDALLGILSQKVGRLQATDRIEELVKHAAQIDAFTVAKDGGQTMEDLGQRGFTAHGVYIPQSSAQFVHDELLHDVGPVPPDRFEEDGDVVHPVGAAPLPVESPVQPSPLPSGLVAVAERPESDHGLQLVSHVEPAPTTPVPAQTVVAPATNPEMPVAPAPTPPPQPAAVVSLTPQRIAELDRLVRADAHPNTRLCSLKHEIGAVEYELFLRSETGTRLVREQLIRDARPADYLGNLKILLGDDGFGRFLTSYSAHHPEPILTTLLFNEAGAQRTTLETIRDIRVYRDVPLFTEAQLSAQLNSDRGGDLVIRLVTGSNNPLQVCERLRELSGAANWPMLVDRFERTTGRPLLVDIVAATPEANRAALIQGVHNERGQLFTGAQLDHYMRYAAGSEALVIAGMEEEMRNLEQARLQLPQAMAAYNERMAAVLRRINPNDPVTGRETDFDAKLRTALLALIPDAAKRAEANGKATVKELCEFLSEEITARRITLTGDNASFMWQLIGCASQREETRIVVTTLSPDHARLRATITDRRAAFDAVHAPLLSNYNAGTQPATPSRFDRTIDEARVYVRGLNQEIAVREQRGSYDARYFELCRERDGIRFSALQSRLRYELAHPQEGQRGYEQSQLLIRLYLRQSEDLAMRGGDASFRELARRQLQVLDRFIEGDRVAIGRLDGLDGGVRAQLAQIDATVADLWSQHRAQVAEIASNQPSNAAGFRRVISFGLHKPGVYVRRDNAIAERDRLEGVIAGYEPRRTKLNEQLTRQADLRTSHDRTNRTILDAMAGGSNPDFGKAQRSGLYVSGGGFLLRCDQAGSNANHSAGFRIEGHPNPVAGFVVVGEIQTRLNWSVTTNPSPGMTAYFDGQPESDASRAFRSAHPNEEARLMAVLAAIPETRENPARSRFIAYLTAHGQDRAVQSWFGRATSGADLRAAIATMDPDSLMRFTAFCTATRQADQVDALLRTLPGDQQDRVRALYRNITGRALGEDLLARRPLQDSSGAYVCHLAANSTVRDEDFGGHFPVHLRGNPAQFGQAVRQLGTEDAGRLNPIAAGANELTQEYGVRRGELRAAIQMGIELSDYPMVQRVEGELRALEVSYRLGLDSLIRASGVPESVLVRSMFRENLNQLAIGREIDTVNELSNNHGPHSRAAERIVDLVRGGDREGALEYIRSLNMTPYATYCLMLHYRRVANEQNRGLATNSPLYVNPDIRAVLNSIHTGDTAWTQTVDLVLDRPPGRSLVEYDARRLSVLLDPARPGRTSVENQRAVLDVLARIGTGPELDRALALARTRYNVTLPAASGTDWKEVHDFVAAVRNPTPAGEAERLAIEYHRRFERLGSAPSQVERDRIAQELVQLHVRNPAAFAAFVAGYNERYGAGSFLAAIPEQPPTLRAVFSALIENRRVDAATNLAQYATRLGNGSGPATVTNLYLVNLAVRLVPAEADRRQVALNLDRVASNLTPDQSGLPAGTPVTFAAVLRQRNPDLGQADAAMVVGLLRRGAVAEANISNFLEQRRDAEVTFGQIRDLRAEALSSARGLDEARFNVGVMQRKAEEKREQMTRDVTVGVAIFVPLAAPLAGAYTYRLYSREVDLHRNMGARLDTHRAAAWAQVERVDGLRDALRANTAAMADACLAGDFALGSDIGSRGSRQVAETSRSVARELNRIGEEVNRDVKVYLDALKVERAAQARFEFYVDLAYSIAKSVVITMIACTAGPWVAVGVALLWELAEQGYHMAFNGRSLRDAVIKGSINFAISCVDILLSTWKIGVTLARLGGFGVKEGAKKVGTQALKEGAKIGVEQLAKKPFITQWVFRFGNLSKEALHAIGDPKLVAKVIQRGAEMELRAIGVGSRFINLGAAFAVLGNSALHMPEARGANPVDPPFRPMRDLPILGDGERPQGRARATWGEGFTSGEPDDVERGGRPGEGRGGAPGGSGAGDGGSDFPAAPGFPGGGGGSSGEGPGGGDRPPAGPAGAGDGDGGGRGRDGDDGRGPAPASGGNGQGEPGVPFNLVNAFIRFFRPDLGRRSALSGDQPTVPNPRSGYQPINLTGTTNTTDPKRDQTGVFGPVMAGPGLDGSGGRQTNGYTAALERMEAEALAAVAGGKKKGAEKNAVGAAPLGAPSERTPAAAETLAVVGVSIAGSDFRPWSTGSASHRPPETFVALAALKGKDASVAGPAGVAGGERGTAEKSAVGTAQANAGVSGTSDANVAPHVQAPAHGNAVATAVSDRNGSTIMNGAATGSSNSNANSNANAGANASADGVGLASPNGFANGNGAGLADGAATVNRTSIGIGNSRLDAVAAGNAAGLSRTRGNALVDTSAVGSSVGVEDSIGSGLSASNHRALATGVPVSSSSVVANGSTNNIAESASHSNASGQGSENARGVSVASAAGAYSGRTNPSNASETVVRIAAKEDARTQATATASAAARVEAAVAVLGAAAPNGVTGGAMATASVHAAAARSAAARAEAAASGYGHGESVADVIAAAQSAQAAAESALQQMSDLAATHGIAPVSGTVSTVSSHEGVSTEREAVLLAEEDRADAAEFELARAARAVDEAAESVGWLADDIEPESEAPKPRKSKRATDHAKKARDDRMKQLMLFQLATANLPDAMKERLKKMLRDMGLSEVEIEAKVAEILALQGVAPAEATAPIESTPQEAEPERIALAIEVETARPVGTGTEKKQSDGPKISRAELYRQLKRSGNVT